MFKSPTTLYKLKIFITIQIQKLPICDNFKEEMNLQPITEKFTANKFNPEQGNENEIPDEAGNYIICLKKGSSIPDQNIKTTYCQFNGLNVLYTGIAGKSLRKRDYRQHFKGHAGRSTLRKSIGVLFGYKKIPRDKNIHSGKTKFNATDEEKLSTWMKQHLIMFFYPNEQVIALENKLIEVFNPPLNLSKNRNPINLKFRKYLSKMRSN